MKAVKVIASILLASCMVSGAFASGKKDEKKEVKFGVLSYLNISETEYGKTKVAGAEIMDILSKENYVKREEKSFAVDKSAHPVTVYYDSLDALVMALTSGEIYSIGSLPQTTARYLSAQNPSIAPAFEFDWKKARTDGGFALTALNLLGDGFSFMMREDQSALRDDFNKVIAEMEKDGSLDALVFEYVLKTDNLKPIELEQKPGRATITVAVTGSLPPFDYVAADGTFAGFNTAFLAEVGKRLDRNIKLVQVSSVGRATALASGTVDAVFWTRSTFDPSFAKMSDEDFLAYAQQKGALTAERERAALRNYLLLLPPKKHHSMDMPSGTIVTNPYFKDIPVAVYLKK